MASIKPHRTTLAEIAHTHPLQLTHHMPHNRHFTKYQRSYATARKRYLTALHGALQPDAFQQVCWHEITDAIHWRKQQPELSKQLLHIMVELGDPIACAELLIGYVSGNHGYPKDPEAAESLLATQQQHMDEEWLRLFNEYLTLNKALKHHPSLTTLVSGLTPRHR